MRHTVRTVIVVLVVWMGLALVAEAASGAHVPFLQAYASFCAWVKDRLSSAGVTLEGLDRGDPGVDAGAPAADAGVPQRQSTPLSSAQLGAPLVRGPFVRECGAPDDMKVVLKVTVKMGRAANVDAATAPHNPTVESCIERAVRELKWDISPQTAHVTVRY